MGKKEQLQQNLNDCHRLLSKCSYMIQVMIKTVNRGEKADEICKFLLNSLFIHKSNISYSDFSKLSKYHGIRSDGKSKIIATNIPTIHQDKAEDRGPKISG